jgi:hypothetical protein
VRLLLLLLFVVVELEEGSGSTGARAGRSRGLCCCDVTASIFAARRSACSSTTSISMLFIFVRLLGVQAP